MYELNKENFTLKIGQIVIYLPDYFSNFYSIFQDLISILKTNTNNDCEVILRKEFNLPKKIKLDSESDNVLIKTKDSKLIIEVTEFLNRQIGINLTKEETEYCKHILDTWKRPKGQKWREGDIFSTQLNNGNYIFSQVIEDYRGLPICLIFNGIYSKAPSLNTILTSEPLSILMITIDDLISHNYKILYNSLPVLKLPIPKKRDKIRTYTFASNSIEKIAEGKLGLIPWEEKFDITLVTNIFK